MRPAYLLAALAPVALAGQAHPRDFSPDLDLHLARNPVALIPEHIIAREPFPVVESGHNRSTQHSARNVLQARSEGSLGQTPWIGMAIGLTCTAAAAVMLG
ncbi:hypothetical protein N7448_009397 [Penicillium atrosanguineum]|uniref:Uncharacterized protein n=1 Tax=Penicillium atrosanguineum TaxID=1132637 RepID=A0A9W9Q3Q5_9EURO|nr:uncharacterized protein N7443_006649 [Penicillium atrosanguineum]KAJ5123300.1 hypothetical protein N7448_009397 [Penicillium atrosanguineum]KAJ5141932.1 hypothetical protein N7526_002927 [Penicillium atrosanguineum]KAJ5298529.1 hypothetical protein N7443_006649 [Penicillium atrosanguineum]KAJ5321207.1 hypothetical protein N7476_004209 [Penicillium atrosanguineum]